MGRIRRTVQFAALLITNGYWPGLGRIAIYSGPAKGVCVPFLNCYSCPAALFACPLGSLQSMLAAARTLPLYVSGMMLAAGFAVGRLFCGWLCPYGLLQEALALPRARRVRLPRWIRAPKYVLLALVVLLPVVWVSAGAGVPFFCKFICPAGTLEGGLVLALGRPELRVNIGWLFAWKVAVLTLFLALMPFIYRVFCRTACPLGAFYGLFNQVSLWRIERDRSRCRGCGTCVEVCPVGVPVVEKPNHPECIRCLECVKACPYGALAFTMTEVGKQGSGGTPRISNFKVRNGR
ncbi:MAG TPA: 4Fe-4S binding protein [Desulfotomaculum sp.]|nr:4Fe-4S binding protein [Desulfotomaculum sp.]